MPLRVIQHYSDWVCTSRRMMSLIEASDIVVNSLTTNWQGGWSMVADMFCIAKLLFCKSYMSFCILVKKKLLNAFVRDCRDVWVGSTGTSFTLNNPSIT